MHNKITRLVTLTWGGEGVHDRDEALKAVQSFIRKFVCKRPGIRWCYTLEVHPSGHGFHVHLGINKWTDKALIAECWTHGFVDVRLIRTKHRGDSRRMAQLAAKYLAKYATKAEDEGRAGGRHRYERMQGHNPTEVELSGDLWEMVSWLEAHCPIVYRWDSAESDTWRGPRTIILRE